MKLHFTKMHGIGNDFIVLDHTKSPFRIQPLKTLISNIAFLIKMVVRLSNVAMVRVVFTDL